MDTSTRKPAARAAQAVRLPPGVKAAFAYADSVLAGKVVVGKLARHQCERHARDLESGAKRGLFFDVAAAEKALGFFPDLLRHSKGEWAGRPAVLEGWQQLRLASIFGWKKKDSGLRRFRTAYNAVARKNGKSFEVAGVGLLMLCSDKEAGAEIYSYATKKEQAKIVWAQARSMVKRSPRLSRRLRAGATRIAYLATESWFEALGQDDDTMDGLNPHLGIGDEVHAQKTAGAFDVIDSAMGSRRQPLHYLITTRGNNRSGLCGELDDYSEKVLSGEVHDDRWFASIYALDEDDDWLDEAAWVKANPNLGVSVKLEDLRRLAAAARQMPGRQNEFRRKRCNLWIGSTSRWIDYEAWKTASADVDDDALDGRPCRIGIDLSAINDLTCMALEWDLPDGSVVLRCRFWTPEQGLDERERRDRVPYRLWARQGWLETTPGATVNRRVVAEALAAELAASRVVSVSYDRWRIRELLDELVAIGVAVQHVRPDGDGVLRPRPGAGVPLIDAGQGFRDMSPCVDEFETLIGDGRLLHGGNPVLTMCAANAVIQFDPAGNRKFAKAKATGRIDGVVAAAMALGARRRIGAEPARSVYETRGVVVL